MFDLSSNCSEMDGRAMPRMRKIGVSPPTEVSLAIQGLSLGVVETLRSFGL
jgi:hypothetical protein